MKSSFNQHTNQSLYAWLLFLLWPFGMAGVALKNYRASYAKNIIWAFTVFYGLTFVTGGEASGADILVYIEDYQFLHEQSLDFNLALTYFLMSGEVDILRTLIAVLLSRITDHPEALTVVYAIIYGYFFSRNMWFILDRLDGRLKWYTLVMMIVLFLVIPIWNVNGFRMWTAAHIFTFGLFQVYFNNNKYGVWLIASSVLVHFSYIVPIMIYIGYRLIGNRITLYMVFFIATLFVSEINISAFNTFVESYAPEIIQERSEGYRSVERVDRFRSGELYGERNWYVEWYGRALKWSVAGYLVLIWLYGFTSVKEEKHMVSLFSFIILFYGVANLLSSIPSGGRFTSVVNISAVGFIVLYLQNIQLPKPINLFSYISFPALILYIIVTVRIGFYSIGLQSVASNPIVSMFFIDEGISLNEVLRLIF